MADNNKDRSRFGAGPTRSTFRKCCGACTSSISPIERIDAGMAFGRNSEPDYLAMNPNGARADAGGRRFRAVGIQFDHALSGLAHRPESTLYPQAPKIRAGIDRWLDWTLSTVQPVDRPVFWALVRTPLGAARHGRDPEGRRRRGCACGGSPMPGWRRGASSKATISRWPISRSARLRGAGSGSKASASRQLPHLARWFAQFSERPGFRAIHRAADVVTRGPANRCLGLKVRSKPQTLKQQNADNHGQRDHRHR